VCWPTLWLKHIFPKDWYWHWKKTQMTKLNFGPSMFHSYQAYFSHSGAVWLLCTLHHLQNTCFCHSICSRHWLWCHHQNITINSG
jgi:hypothetical protein